MAMKMKPEDELVLRAVRWTWWNNFVGGRTNGISADEVARTISRSHLIPDNWRRDLTGRVNYRMKKLADMGYLANTSRYRWSHYELTRMGDTDAVDAINILKLEQENFATRVTSVQRELEDLMNSVLPGTYNLRMEANRRPAHKPQAWTMSVSLHLPVANLKYFLKMAKEYLDTTEPEPD